MEKEQIYIGEIGKHIMLKPMDKQEAIEVMAKAICKSDGICTSHDCENCTEWSGNDILVAEIALNALLERCN